MSFEIKQEERGFAPGWTMFWVDEKDTSQPKDKAGNHPTKKRLDIILRTDAGEKRVHYYLQDANDDGIIVGEITQPGSGGKTLKFLLEPESSKEAFISVGNERWHLKRGEGKLQLFAFLDKLPPKGEMAEEDDIDAELAAMRKARKKK